MTKSRYMNISWMGRWDMQGILVPGISKGKATQNYDKTWKIEKYILILTKITIFPIIFSTY